MNKTCAALAAWVGVCIVITPATAQSTTDNPAAIAALHRNCDAQIRAVANAARISGKALAEAQISADAEQTFLTKILPSSVGMLRGMIDANRDHGARGDLNICMARIPIRQPEIIAKAAPEPTTRSMQQVQSAVASAAAPQAAPPTPNNNDAQTQVSLELALWNTVANSNDPAQLNAYLEKYPSGNFAGVARAKIAALSQPAPTAAPPKTTAQTPPATSAPANTRVAGLPPNPQPTAPQPATPQPALAANTPLAGLPVSGSGRAEIPGTGFSSAMFTLPGAPNQNKCLNLMWKQLDYDTAGREAYPLEGTPRHYANIQGRYLVLTNTCGQPIHVVSAYCSNISYVNGWTGGDRLQPNHSANQQTGMNPMGLGLRYPLELIPGREVMVGEENDGDPSAGKDQYRSRAASLIIGATTQAYGAKNQEVLHTRGARVVAKLNHAATVTGTEMPQASLQASNAGPPYPPAVCPSTEELLAAWDSP